MKVVTGKAFVIGFYFNHRHVLLLDLKNEPRAFVDTSITGCHYHINRNFKSTSYNDIVTSLKTHITVSTRLYDDYSKP